MSFSRDFGGGGEQPPPGATPGMLRWAGPWLGTKPAAEDPSRAPLFPREQQQEARCDDDLSTALARVCLPRAWAV